MNSEIAILKIAGALGRHSAERHAVIAENVANANTPGYVAKDIESFAEAYRRLGAKAATSEFAPKTINSLGAISPNGNSVSLEDQIMRAGEASRAGEIAATIFSKAISMLRAAAARPR